VVVPKWRIVLLAVVAAPLVLFALTAAAWAIDTRGDSAHASRGVVLAGHDIAGKTRDQLSSVVDELAAQLPSTPITIQAPTYHLTTTAADLGVRVDAKATLDAAMSKGRDDPGPMAPIRWAKALVADRPIPLVLTVDRAKATQTIHQLEGPRRTEPTEPTIKATATTVEFVPGKDGTGIDVGQVLAALPSSATNVGKHITISANQHAEHPTITDAEVKALALKAEANTARPIAVTVGGSTKNVDATTLRAGFGVAPGADGHPTLTLDPKVVGPVLATAFPPSPNPTNLTFTLVNGKMLPVPGKNATVCCAPSAPQALAAAVLAGQKSATLDTRTLTAADAANQAAALGVQQVVGEFTTHHPAGQPRVINIHRIADLTRGQYIAPGATFSVNGFIGQRTTAKGFVVAPVIEDGEFSTDVGGGISQYATTLFNAAFFAGLDIPQYKAHSIYISRYPFGREATLAYPSVDLKIHNNTPYGVVIWTSYTNSSLTVQLWSTRYVTGAQTAQNKSSGCGPISTTRTRTYVDGHTDQQVFHADYTCNPPKE
jgi:vancomycin resistance protein YoaR